MGYVVVDILYISILWMCILHKIYLYLHLLVPNSPAYINISQRTNSSLSLQWPTPNLMEDAPNISYNITYQPRGRALQTTNSTVNNTNLLLLLSGTLYDITVATVGPQNLMSMVVSNSSYTCKYNMEKARSVSVAYSD